MPHNAYRLPLATLASLFLLTCLQGVEAQSGDSSFDGSFTLTAQAEASTGLSETYVLEGTDERLVPTEHGYLATMVRLTSSVERCSVFNVNNAKNVATAANGVCGLDYWGNNMYVTTTTGVYVSNDGGSTYSLKTLDSSSIFGSVGAASNTLVIAQTSDTTTSTLVHWVSTNSGSSFSAAAGTVTNSGLSAQGELFYMGGTTWIQGNRFTSDYKFLTTTDNFATVTSTTAPFQCAAAYSVAVYGSDLFCFFQYASIDSLHSTSNDLGVIVSHDNGLTWDTATRIYVAPAGDSLSPKWGFSTGEAVYVVGTHTIGTASTMFMSTSPDGDNWQTYELVTGDTPTAILGAAVDGDGELNLYYRTGTLNSNANKHIAVAQVESAGTQVTFCADPTSDEVSPDGGYGYDYVEDVVFDDDLAAPTLEDAFVMSGDNDDSGYLGYGFTTGSRSFKTIARIEASEGASNSLFRISYTPGSSGAPSSLNKGTGGGETDQDFSQQVQAQFRESSGHWVIGIYQTLANSRALLGGSVNYGDSDEPITFNFTIDSRAGYLYAAVRADDGTTILNRSIDSSLTGTFWKNVWLIGKGNTAIDADTVTYVDDNTDPGQNDDSTCIFDLLGGAVVGEGGAGTTPDSMVADFTGTSSSTGSSTCSSVICTTETTVPEGFTVAAFNGFLGLLLMATITVGGTSVIYVDNPKGKIAGGVVGAFAVIGYLIALYFGLLPVWPVVAGVIIAAAIVFIRFKSGG